MIAIPAHIATLLPPRGPCAFCGCDDARHRILDAIDERVSAGDDPADVATDYRMPVAVVMDICQCWDGDRGEWAT